MSRGTPGSTPGHGTHARYVSGCRCDECRRARAAYQKRSNYLRLAGRPGLVVAIGTRRRLQALACLGWPPQHAAERLGVTKEYVRQLRMDTRPTVERATAERVSVLYDELSMTPGPSVRARMFAARQGWAPPLAWDDIDNPDERPDLGVPSRGADLDEWMWLVNTGEDPQRAAERLNVTLHAIERAAYRNNRTDVTAIANAARHAERKAS